MTASTVSGEKKKSNVELVNDGVLSPLGEHNAVRRAAGDSDEIVAKSSKDLRHSIREKKALVRSKDMVQLKTPLQPNSPRRTRKSTSSKPQNTLLSDIIKEFVYQLVSVVVVLILMWFFTMEDRNFDVQSYIKNTATMLESQLEAVDKKIEVEALSLRGELNKKLEENDADLNNSMKTLDEKHESIKKALDQLSSKGLLSKEDFAIFYEEFRKSKIGNSGHSDLSLNEIRALARQIVEKEMGKHAADGLGKVDYALATGGALIAHHSEPFIIGKDRNLCNRQGVHNDAEKMLKPSFGEPGQCFPLKGNSGFVQIRLRTAIIPDAVTLEHVAKSVAFDRSNAPRDCRVYGWLQGAQNLDADNVKTLLTEFTYDLEKSNAQTYNVFGSATSAVVDTIRFDFTSNHGSPSHTCIYRVRVHGREPNSLSHLGAVLH